MKFPQHSLRTYSSASLPEQTKPPRKKQRLGTRSRSGGSMDILSERPYDHGAFMVDKRFAELPQEKKRRRIGGIIAAVSGCRIFLD